MNQTHYNVIYRGKLLQGFEFENAKQNLIHTFSISDEKAEKILKSRQVVLKKNTDESTAKKFGVALKKVGLDVALTESPPKVMPHTAIPAVALKKTERTPSSIPFEFKGTGSEYFKIWLVNVILSILTLGIYSPWAKVRRKQYFYGSTHIQGSSFEYLADPVKILKGRAMIVGFFVINSIVSDIVPIVGSILALAIVVIFPWLVVRSLAFNARNSALRNIRFGFEGTVGQAAKVYILWPILAAFTLGILSPYAYFRQKKFIVENSSYGTTNFRFTATAREYYWLFFSALMTMVLGFVVVAAFGFLFPPAAFLLGIAAYLYLFAFFSVKTTNLLYNSSQLARHRLQATLRIKEYISLVVVNAVATALTLGVFYPWAKVRTLRYKLEHVTIVASGDLDSFIAKEQKQVSALGEEMSDFLDFDFGI
ncbi:MAG TPA: DUF898 domain-containing protein [Desulfobacterales bacterium]|nr:DUF898 domain-containing protein [Desulfobacterales bacterium]